MRVTTWPGIVGNDAYNTVDGRLIVAGLTTIGQYTGYTDNGISYLFRYLSNPFTFGDSSRLKFPKQIDLTFLSGNAGKANVLWSFDYSVQFQTKQIDLNSGVNVFEFGEAEYGQDGGTGPYLSEYTGGVSLTRAKTNPGGSGCTVTFGLEVDIEGEEFSLQEINVQALIGRIV